MLTTFDLDEYVYRAIRAGASGFLLKDVRPAELVHAVRVISSGDTLLAPAITRRLLEEFMRRPPPGQRPAGVAELTERVQAVVLAYELGLVRPGDDPPERLATA
jgi:DNA-binding NarL/FixJ family response regulator